jgi:uncharacterized membrane protein YkvA (DUF1232 family)
MSLIGNAAENALSLLIVVLAAYLASKAVASLASAKGGRQFWRFPYDLAEFILGLRGDPRVPFRTWAFILFPGLYWVSPVDVMPALVPGPALLDDLVIAVVCLRIAINSIPRVVRRERCPPEAAVLRRYLGLW